MGNSQSGAQKPQKSIEQVIKEINTYSGVFDKVASPDGATFEGMRTHVNFSHGRAGTWKPQSDAERRDLYLDVATLAKKIGMSEERGAKILGEAYQSLNRDDALAKEGIQRPGPSQRNDPRTQASSSNAEAASSASEHPQELRDNVTTLLANQHSYLALSGHKMEHLMSLSTKDLRQAVEADNAFVKGSAGYWNLAEDMRASTVESVGHRFNAQLCNKLGLAHTTNANPTQAFVDGKEAAMNAVSNGYAIYGGTNNEALKLIGQAAVTINLAVGPQTTLAGRGMGTITEQTLSLNPDGHNVSKAPRY